MVWKVFPCQDLTMLLLNCDILGTFWKFRATEYKQLISSVLSALRYLHINMDTYLCCRYIARFLNGGKGVKLFNQSVYDVIAK